MGIEVGNCTLSVDRMISIPVEVFNHLRQNGYLVDLHFITKEKCKVPAHRPLICAKFPEIVGHLERNQGPTMKWPRFSTDLVKSVIDFTYTGEIDINVGNVCQLYLLAHNLGSQPLMDGCWKFIEERFEQINVNEVWMISSILGKHDLMEGCILKIACDFDTFVKDQKCLRCTAVKDMEALLSSSWLQALLDYWRTWDEPEENRKWERIFIYGHYTKIGIPFLSAAPNVRGIKRMFTLPYRKDSCTVACDEYVYVIGSSARGLSSARIFMVNPCNGKMKETEPMAQSRICASAVTVEHEILVFGGSDGSKCLETCEKYSPSERIRHCTFWNTF
nr:kelch protein [Hymenolepis microstoma]